MSEPSALCEPAAHRADAGRGRVVERVPREQPRDHGERVLAACEAGLGLLPQARPGVGSRSRARGTARSRAQRGEVRIERARACARHAAVRPPRAHQRDDEIAPRITTQELERVMPLAEPDPHPVRELALERPPARAIQTDRTHGRLHGNPTSFVERRQACHADSLPEGMHTRLFQGDATPCRPPEPHSLRWRLLRPCLNGPRLDGLESLQMSLAVSVTWPAHPHLEPTGFTARRPARSRFELQSLTARKSGQVALAARAT